MRVRCTACGAAAPWAEDLGLDTACPACGRRGGRLISRVGIPAARACATKPAAG
jgi:DNA-directed RNA polymerase subunit RPC12/RpoP